MLGKINTIHIKYVYISRLYIHITVEGKFFEANTDKVSSIIKKEYTNIYNK